MRQLRLCFHLIAATLLSSSATAQQAEARPWRDPASHRTGYLSTGGARLQFLDWGGQGPFLLLIHGWGSNAHVFDDLAPRLRDKYHVVALTLRGFGASDTVPTDYTLDRYANDIAATLDYFHVRRGNIAAHSFGGWVMTQTVLRYPERVSRVIYLDAAFDMRASDSIVARRPVKRPPLVKAETIEDVMDWLKRDFYGMWTPALEAEYRARPNDEDVRAKQLRTVGAEAERTSTDWSRLPVPALAICALANVSSEFPWLRPADTSFVVARRYVETERRPFQHAECERFRQSRGERRIVELPGHHYIFIQHPAEVSKAIRAFIHSP